MGNYLGPIAVTFALLDRHQSLVLIGLVLAMRGVSAPVASVFGGVLADRWGPRRAMVSSELIRAAAHGGLAMALLMGHAPIWVFIFAELILGVGWAASQPAAGALAVRLVDMEQLSRLNGSRGVAYSLAMIAGPLLGGVLIAGVSPAAALAADAMVYLIALALILTIKVGRETEGDLVRRPITRELRAGWRAIRSVPWIWKVSATFAGFNILAYAGLFLLGPVVAKADLGGAVVWGGVVAALGVGALAGSILAARIPKPQRPAVAVLLLGALWALPLVALGLGAPVVIVMLAAAIAGAGFGLFNPVWHTALQQAIPRDVLGQVLGLDSMVSSIALPLGYFAIGLLASTVPVRLLLLVLAAGWVALALTGVMLAGASVPKLTGSVISSRNDIKANATNR